MDFVRKIWKAMRANFTEHKDLTWLFGITAEGKPLNENERAILFLFWRVIYRRMQFLDRKKCTFKTKPITREISYEFMKRILNFPSGKEEILPEKEKRSQNL